MDIPTWLTSPLHADPVPRKEKENGEKKPLRLANELRITVMPFSLFFAKTLIDMSATTFRHQDAIF